MSSKPMRALMPGVTSLVDAFRSRGMTDNATLAQGMKDGTFWAREDGQEIGKAVQADEVGVRPVLPLEMERRHLDREWKERNALESEQC